MFNSQCIIRTYCALTESFSLTENNLIGSFTLTYPSTIHSGNDCSRWSCPRCIVNLSDLMFIAVRMQDCRHAYRRSTQVSLVIRLCFGILQLMAASQHSPQVPRTSPHNIQQALATPYNHQQTMTAPQHSL